MPTVFSTSYRKILSIFFKFFFVQICNYLYQGVLQRFMDCFDCVRILVAKIQNTDVW